ncbi:MAG: GNAT family N-acetyltransferase [Actinomycetota bacterium]
MSSSLPDGFDVRFATDDDAAAVAELGRACEQEVLGVGVLVEGDVRDWWRITDPGRSVWLIHHEGRLAAAATLWPRGDIPSVWGDVHPELRGRGLGTTLLELTETRAQELGATAIRSDAFARDEKASALLERRGYRPVRRYYEMRIELGDDAPPEPEWPEGLSVAPFRDGDGPAFHAALGESFQDEWGHSPVEYEEWRRARLEAEDFDPEVWAVVRDGDDVAAVVRCDVFRYGGGWVGALGVRKPWRRRGVGLALLHHTFRVFHARGERSVGLGVDSENPTGATRLYERAGMRVESESVTFEKSLG